MSKYEITKEPYLKYVVWEIHRNYRVQVFSGFKYECEAWLNARVNK